MKSPAALSLALLLLLLGLLSTGSTAAFVRCDNYAVGHEKIRPLIKEFSLIDSSHNGRLTQQEVEAYDGDVGVWDNWRDEMDFDENGTIDMREWISSRTCQVCGESDPCRGKMCTVSEDMTSFTCV